MSFLFFRERDVRDIVVKLAVMLLLEYPTRVFPNPNTRVLELFQTPEKPGFIRYDLLGKKHILRFFPTVFRFRVKLG